MDGEDGHGVGSRKHFIGGGVVAAISDDAKEIEDRFETVGGVDARINSLDILHDLAEYADVEKGCVVEVSFRHPETFKQVVQQLLRMDAPARSPRYDGGMDQPPGAGDIAWAEVATAKAATTAINLIIVSSRMSPSKKDFLEGERAPSIPLRAPLSVNRR